MKHAWLFVVILMMSFFFSCSPKGDEKETFQIPINAIDKVIETHPDGKNKAVEYYTVLHGIESIYGFQEFYPSGKVRVQGLYNQDKERDGLWESFYESGLPWSIGTYTNNIENGPKKVWYESGAIRYTGEVKNGQPVGEWSFWDEKGVKKTKVYK